MASVDPYSPCPCGSGQKFKFCCQKVESYAERAQRLVESGQHESALKPLDEGLAKVPDNPWLLTRKALILLHLKQVEPAKQALRALLKKNPTHIGVIMLMTELALETEGPAAGIAQFQQGLSVSRPDQRPQLAPLAVLVGTSLGRSGFPAAALRHLELAQQLGVGSEDAVLSELGSIRGNPSYSLWERNPYRLWPPPEGVSEEFRESFQRALGWAGEGLWSAAASAFELLAAGSSAGAIADRNRGLCCLWIADHDGAIAALRRYIARTGPTIDAVDLEALCQQIGRNLSEEQVEFVQLFWPIRNRQGLLAALRADTTLQEGPGRPLDAKQPEAPPVERFFLLDRPRIAARAGLTRREVPLVEGEVLVGQDHVLLETFDDGRLDRLIDRFTAAAGSNIPPAHPRTKVAGHESRYHVALSWRWNIPAGVPEDDVERLNREQWAYLIREVWPGTPHPALRGRTPLQTAKAGDSETALRAALQLLEHTDEDSADLVDWGQLRVQLHLKPEPAVDPEHLNLDSLHLSRWSLIPVAALADDRLLATYYRARLWRMLSVMNRAARIITERPSLMVKGRIEATTLYGDLALAAARRDDRVEAGMWIERGRQSEPPLKQAAHALLWELIDLQVKIILDEPEVWVPLLAVLLERYRGNPEATTAVLMRLAQFGLVQAGIDPKHPDQIVLDTRVLEQYLSQFGPRVTTATGELGVSASQGQIWTPEAAGGSVTIWTPGSAPPPTTPSGGRPKIILP
jgi:tetratricopeptide (TPR) repeat protein